MTDTVDDFETMTFDEARDHIRDLACRLVKRTVEQENRKGKGMLMIIESEDGLGVTTTGQGKFLIHSVFALMDTIKDNTSKETVMMILSKMMHTFAMNGEDNEQGD